MVGEFLTEGHMAGGGAPPRPVSSKLLLPLHAEAGSAKLHTVLSCLKSQRSMGPQQQTCGNYHTGSRNNYNFKVLKLQFVALLSPVSPVRLIPHADCEDRPHPSGVLGNPAVPIMRIESYQVSSSL